MTEPKTILITGTSSGFGHMAAQQLAEKGNKVYATMRNVNGKNAEQAKALSEFSSNITVLDLDVTQQESVDQAIVTILQQSDKIDVLINNAGIMAVGLTEAFTIEQLQSQMDVNYFGAARMFRAVLPNMRKNKSGLIITITSVAGRLIFPSLPAYNSSKFAIEALAEGYRYDLSQQNIDSIIIEPGPFRTELIENSPTPNDKDVIDQYGDFAQMPLSVIKSFDDFIEENKGTECDPQVVVNDMIELIETPFGSRPLRTVSGLDYGIRELNSINDKYQLNVLDAMELGHLNPNKP